MMTIRMAIFVMGLVGLAVWLVWMRHPGRRMLGVAPVSWLLNLTVFYGCRLAGWPAMGVETINIWSASVHLHAVFLLTTAAVVMIRRRHE